MKKSHQWLLGLAGLGVTGVMLTQSYVVGTANANATDNGVFSGTPDQRATTKKVALFLDGQHYLDQPLDQAMGEKILKWYIDSLDPNHTLFLQSDVDEFTQKYAHNFANYLQRGDLTAGSEIFERYRTRSYQYYDFAKKLLQRHDLNLNTNATIILDREGLSHFKTPESQADYWTNQTLYALINLTLSQDDEKAKDKAFLENPELAKGQDLVKGDERSPAEILTNRLNRQEAQLKRLKSDEIMEGILNSAMQAYDPHSNYFAPVQANEMQIQSSLQLEGIGVSIRPDRKNPDYTRIVTLVDGGPAAKTGQIRPNDLILGVAQDGEAMVDTIGFSTREIVALIRGKRGTSVTIKVKQPNTPDSSARNVTIVRDVIAQEESGVQWRVVNGTHNGKPKKVGVIEIPSFYLNFQARRNGEANYRSVSADTQKALIALNAQKIDGLVVDLRNNGGGSLEEVVKMLGFFIKQGPVVQIKDANGLVEPYNDRDGGRQLYSGQMVVLTNMASASASEIFAAAIQDYGRGLVVGSTTMGKGSAQVQRTDLALGSANLTQKKFYRINGGSTQNKGVVPDVAFVNIYEGAKFSERDYKNPLVWDTIDPSPYRPEGKYSKALIEKVGEFSAQRQAKNPQFIYLNTLNTIRAMDDDKKAVAVNLEKRKAYAKDIENRTLLAENTRRQAMGEKPFTSWATYQAHQDALFEERGAMKENQRPKLPEDEVFVIEAISVMFDSAEPALVKNTQAPTKP